MKGKKIKNQRQAFKLMTRRKDGSLGSLFINRTARHPRRRWLRATLQTTKGFLSRKGWHALAYPQAPHLVLDAGRVWMQVKIRDYVEIERPKSQGNLWFIAQEMMIL